LYPERDSVGVMINRALHDRFAASNAAAAGWWRDIFLAARWRGW
jgi:hypothetical protein